MDCVLDTLLHSLFELVPYESAQIWLVESDARLFLAREAPHVEAAKAAIGYPLTFDATEFPLIYRVLMGQAGLVVSDTKQEPRLAAT